MTGTPPATPLRGRALREVLPVFFRLGLTSFGGPVAHLGYFRAEFVERRKWLDEASYADILALCQFLPGPASSQAGMSIGLMRAGLPGAFCAWLGFTAPSAAVMIAFGYGVTAFAGFAGSAWLHGLMIVAVAVVAQAVWTMARTLTPDSPRMALAVAAALLALLIPNALGQIGAILFGGAVGWFFFQAETHGRAAFQVPLGRILPNFALILFFALLIGLPLAALATPNHTLALIDRFYRAGSLVFGGGHVVLPLLQAAVVPPGWVGNDDFLAGYGAAQAVPGPLFTFAAYLGTVMRPAPNGWLGGLICLAAIFLPSFLLITGVLPLWGRLRGQASIQAVLTGVNAAVVGLLLAALYNPVWTSAIHAPADFGLAVVAFMLLVWRVPPWLVVIAGAAASAGLANII
jgi:chromate transporter